MKSSVCHIIALLAIIIALTTESHAQYFKAATAPDPMSFLPARCNDENNPFWALDIYRHFASKQYRDSSLIDDMKLVNRDYTRLTEPTYMSYYSNYHLKFFLPAFGLTVSRLANVDIFNFLDSCRQSSNQMLLLVPDSCYRTRPSVRLREANFGDSYSAYSHYNNNTYAPNFSFPSNEATSGWLTGLLLSNLNPWRCDTILSTAYRYGWLRLVSGNMWQSDLDASRELGTVAFAQLMSIPKFRSRLRAMKQRTANMLPSPNVGLNLAASPPPTIDELVANDTLLAKIASHIPTMGDENDGAFQGDLAYYMSLKSLRDSLASGDLLGSSYMDIDNPLDAFLPVLDVMVSARNTPNLYKLFSAIESCCEQMCHSVEQRSPSRRRPYEVFGHEPYTLEDIASLSQHNSYPSLHASTGMATALLLMMIVPSQRDTILQMGYQYGMYRVISGTNWYSDLSAGRVLGCLSLAVVSSGSDFMDTLEAAQQEYRDQQDVIITDMPGLASDQQDESIPLFTIDGRRASPQSRGILVGKDRKILIR